MKRFSMLFLPVLFATACSASPSQPPRPVTVAPPSATGEAVAPPEKASARVADERFVTVLPYEVTDGMEYGPSRATLNAAGKLELRNIAGLPDRPGYSLLVELEPNGPMPERYRDMQDVNWPAWKVKRVVAERREDDGVDWSAPVVSATIERTDACLQATVHVFESYAFCVEVPLSPGSSPGFLFLEKNFYPFPEDGSPLGVTAVPELAPVAAP